MVGELVRYKTESGGDLCDYGRVKSIDYIHEDRLWEFRQATKINVGSEGESSQNYWQMHLKKIVKIYQVHPTKFNQDFFV